MYQSKSKSKPVKMKSSSAPKPKSNTLSPSQTAKLKEHKQHHSAKHMTMMRKDMRAGMSFTNAHKKAQRMVGK
tara:strand:- start:19477 stop:19695 length:219 start_codon:yes stop_codon:yes gene_type:complete